MRILPIFSPFAVFAAISALSSFPLWAQTPARIRAQDVQPEKELFITHPTVLNSEFATYPGPWSFGGLVEEIVGKEHASETIRKWLLCYSEESMVGPHNLNGDGEDGDGGTFPELSVQKLRKQRLINSIPPRPGIVDKVIAPWQKKDGYINGSVDPWQPNLANAPFRLLAIVNRMDLGAPGALDLERSLHDRWKVAGKEKMFQEMVSLATLGKVEPFFAIPNNPRGGMGYGSSSSPAEFGEGRLVFGAIGSDGLPLAGNWTLIFEFKLQVFKIPGNQEQTAVVDLPLQWARAWHALADIDLSDQRFAAELSQVTRRFTHRENGGRSGGFSQLRSSEASFGPGREFRQFKLGNNALVPDSLPLTPGPQFMENTREGGKVLAGFLSAIEPLVLAGAHAIPSTLTAYRKTLPMLANRAIIPDGESNFHWDPKPGVSQEARRLFSMATCNGCHAGETGCADGLHVRPRKEGEAAALSAFLRSDGQHHKIRDPASRGMVQLAEMEDRAEILAALLEPREFRRLNLLKNTLQNRLRRSH